MKTYRPRRAGKHWLENAPEYILDIFDHGQFADRYTILFGGSLFDPSLLETGRVYSLGLSERPDSPGGVSLWGSCPATWRPARHRITWDDLPENVKEHIKRRVHQCIVD